MSVKVKTLCGDEMPDRYRLAGHEVVFAVTSLDGSVVYFESDEEAAIAAARMTYEGRDKFKNDVCD